MILLIDNYDSFSYNLYQLIGAVAKKLEPKDERTEIYREIRVIRNDEMTVEEIKALNPALIVLSPGPGRPADAGICEEVVRSLKGKIPIFGVCLGHQAICEAYGATVTYAKELMHGKKRMMKKSPDAVLFRGISNEFPAARYHSLAVDKNTLPPELSVAAVAEDGEIMAVEDRENKVFGLQFHPESIMTPGGETMLWNLLKMAV